VIKNCADFAHKANPGMRVTVTADRIGDHSDFHEHLSHEAGCRSTMTAGTGDLPGPVTDEKQL
jgi:hypothetical protein